MRRAAIRELPFRHNQKPGLGIEIFRLADLFSRARTAKLDHELDAPQRPEFHTVYIGLRGRGHVVIDFTPVPIGSGTLTVLARGRVQQFAPRTRRDADVDAWMILFSPEFVTPGARSTDPLANASILSPAWAMPALPLRGDDQSELLTLAAHIAAEQARPLDVLQPALLASYLRAVLLRAERIANAEITQRPPPPPELQRFFTILDRDCLDTRSVAQIARRAGISPRRLGELLVAHIGKSTKQVVDDRVVLEHKRLLAHTDISVKELADRTGFAEPTNLVKFFRHHTGMTPLEFRRSVPGRAARSEDV
jgi:AraC-like DNA-binding protein